MGAPPHRRAALLAAGLLGVWLAVAPSAPATTNFGTVGYDRTSFGSLVSLSTPSAGLFQESDEFVLHRDVVQSDPNLPADPGLIQVGVYRSGGGFQLDNCGAPTSYRVFTEVKRYGSPDYKCQVYRPVSPGTVLTLDVFRLHPAATWGIRVNGAPTGSSYSLGFNKGAPAIGTEIQDYDNTWGTHTATRFGPARHTPWSVYRKVGRGSAHRLGRGDPTSPYPTSDAFWRLPRPPTPMTIKHRQ